jgi:predicted XRE-type DNA-binding protein
MNTKRLPNKGKKDDFVDQKELLRNRDYLLTKYQHEIFREVKQYMEKNELSQKDMANKLGVSDAYVSQILNGNFNFTLKKLIDLGIAIDKVPRIRFEKK